MVLALCRNRCISNNNPNLYNDYLRELNHTLNSVKKPKLWLDIIEGDLGLIGQSVHKDSSVTDEEARDFMMPPAQEDTKPKVEEKTQEEEEEDMVRSFDTYITTVFKG